MAPPLPVLPVGTMTGLCLAYVDTRKSGGVGVETAAQSRPKRARTHRNDHSGLKPRHDFATFSAFRTALPGAVGRFQRIQRSAKGIGPSQVLGFADLGRAVGVPTAARQQHTSIVKADVVYQGELVVGLGLLECPEEIVRRPG